MYCDKCMKEKNEVKRLSLGGEAGVFLCKECFNDEIGYREYMRNRYGSKFKIEKWENLKIYRD